MTNSTTSRAIFVLAIAILFFGYQEKVVAQDEGIGTLPRAQVLPVLQSAPSDYDGDGLSDLLEVITLKTDPNSPNPAAIEFSPTDPNYFRLLVWQPWTQVLLVTGEIHVSFLTQLGAAIAAQAPTQTAASSPSSSGQGVPPSTSKGQPLSSSAYRPLEPSPSETIQENSLCVQQTEVVGVVGSSIILEVIEANCESFDGTCSPNACKATAGTTTTALDPQVLIGG